MRLPRLPICIAALALVLATAMPAHAVILYKNARNIYAPGGTLYNSGWQYEGKFGSFLGTPISPRHFITAGHIGGYVGQSFTWGGRTFKTTAMYDDPSTDLRIWKVDSNFWSYAPIYTGSYELGKTAITFGRGTQKGTPVVKNNVTKGWRWGAGDGVQTWGTNVAASTVYGGADKGTLLKFNFNATGGTADEAALSTGDSGGGVFINDNGKWKLAGINFLVDGPFSLTGGADAGFMGSIFDKGGLYTKSGTSWVMNYDALTDVPTAWYATRISSRASWIQSVLGQSGYTAASLSTGTTGAVPEPGTLGVLAVAAVAAMTRRRQRR